MTIAQRLYLGFGLVIALILVIALVGWVKIGAVDAVLTQVNDVDSRKQRFAINFRGSVHDRAISIRDAVLVDSSAERQPFLREITELDAFYQQSAREMDQLFASHQASSEERQLLGNIQAIEKRTVRLTENTLNLLAQSDSEAARQLLMTQVSPAYSEWLAAINAFIDYQERDIQRQVAFVRAETSGFQTLILVIAGVSLVLAVVISVRLVNNLSRTIGGEPEVAARLIRQVASGDLTLDIPTRHPDSIMGAVASMTRQLAGIIKEVAQSSETLSSAAQQMSERARRNQQLVSMQREQTEQGAAAISQMSATVQGVVGHTLMASNLANSAHEETLAGGAEVKRTLTSIDELAYQVQEAGRVIDQLSEDSNAIGTVLEVIETIAEQTNLLALNAAIEAARAGEHGRGFAVVADEVRALASRTQESTRDIQQRIEKMQSGARGAVEVMERGRNKAAQSVEQARRAGDSLEAIQRSVNDINDMNTQIASAAEEQSAVADEINRNFSSITEASEEAAQGMQENVEASRALAELARNLQSSVGKFRV
ncbi:methyl-accepting chemotaxis protein [Marinospirillum alkaliphilum]|uniref:Methyl-accepting chemotaxis protein n=1 Tax=Marinospirillum alkaliphilum DSM 21637 TaxID=1122209 RepID=A0A1K1X274_9GAMM|nr:methyl-accepting chemotaxis protein [Marinospirillum alkaliphilum]SFX43754.1 methyl-accepting chemotaxis protein [Marinospirillum alkaliphilum DSM 21637]